MRGKWGVLKVWGLWFKKFWGCLMYPKFSLCRLIFIYPCGFFYYNMYLITALLLMNLDVLVFNKILSCSIFQCSRNGIDILDWDISKSDFLIDPILYEINICWQNRAKISKLKMLRTYFLDRGFFKSKALPQFIERLLF